MLATRRFLNLGLLIAIELLYYRSLKPGDKALFFLFWLIVGAVLTVVAMLRGIQGQTDRVNQESEERPFKEMIDQVDMRQHGATKKNRTANQIAFGLWILFDIINVSLYFINRT